MFALVALGGLSLASLPFLAGPYLAFTVAGCIGWFEKPLSSVRWIGMLLPPALYALPFVVARVRKQRAIRAQLPAG